MAEEVREAHPLTLYNFLVQEEPWMDEGTCRVEGVDPDLFVLQRGHTASEAQKVCARCPHRKPCLAYGKRTGSVGVWGGEVLTLSNRNGVEVRPLVMLTDSRPVENLVNPPPTHAHQDPTALFG